MCTDGARNACSMLYGACWRTAKGLGYKRAITYTLPEEGGASLRAAGWVYLGRTKGGAWSRTGRQRSDTHPLGDKDKWGIGDVTALKSAKHQEQFAEDGTEASCALGAFHVKFHDNVTCHLIAANAAVVMRQTVVWRNALEASAAEHGRMRAVAQPFGPADVRSVEHVAKVDRVPKRSAS